jgi:gluconolactonase
MADRLRADREIDVQAKAGNLPPLAFASRAFRALPIWLAVLLPTTTVRAEGRPLALETLVTADTIFEGPTWVQRGRSGYLLLSDVPGNVINKLGPSGGLSPVAAGIFRGRASEAFQSTGEHKFLMVGANGTTLDRHGRVVYCAFSDGEIVRIEANGQRTVLAREYAGQRLNAPNDLVYGPDGSLYFTDSRAGTRRADGDGVPHKGLYRLKGSHVELLSQEIDHPNGLAFSPDGKFLYVTNTLRKNVLRFDVRPDGITDEQVFVDMSGDARAGGPDGIKVDRTGKVYATGPGGIWIISPDGRHMDTIETAKQATNLAFGGRDRRMLYVTAMGAVYRVRLGAQARPQTRAQ